MKHLFLVLMMMTLIVTSACAQATPTATATATPTATASPATINGLIAFTSSRDGNSEIYVMDANWDNPRNLVDNRASDFNPAWSPDGTQIAFSSERSGNSEIYAMNADGSNPRNLSNNSEFDRSPAWSPDGARIAFSSGFGGDSEIYVMDADGSNPRNLTNNSNLASNESPAWSPDGTQIVFNSSQEIYVMDADGSNPRNLTNNRESDHSPTWSPDGMHIAFVSGRDGNPEIYVMDADGNNPRNLTNHSADDREPAWSPDGSQIAFVSGRDGNSEIYVMNADGSNLSRLTNNSVSDHSPAWSPNSEVSRELIEHSTYVPPTETPRPPTPTRTPLPRPTSTPFPTFSPPTGTALPPTITVLQLPTTAITNGNASQLQLLGTVPLPVSMDITGISADRRVIIIGGSVIGGPQQLYAYDLTSLRLFELPNAGGYRDFTQPEIAISPDGSYIAYPNGSTITVYGTTEQSVVATLRGHTDTVQAIAFSPTGLTLATAGSDEVINLWEVGSWMLSRSFERSDMLGLRVDDVHSLAFSPNGQALLAGTYANVDLWSVTTGELAGSMGSSVRDGVIAVTFGETSQIMVVPAAAALVGLTEQGAYTNGRWSGGVVDVWSLQTGNVTADFLVGDTNHFDVNEGANLLVTEDMGSFNVYSFFTTERIFTGTGSYSYPTKVYFARNDTLLVVVKENEIQLWGIR